MKNQAEQILERIKIALDASNNSEIASKLGIKQQSVASAKKRNKIPADWIHKIAEKYSISSDWLFFGIGTKELGGKASGALPLCDHPNGGVKLALLLDEIVEKVEKEGLSIPFDMKVKAIALIFLNSACKGEQIDTATYNLNMSLIKMVYNSFKTRETGSSKSKEIPDDHEKPTDTIQ